MILGLSLGSVTRRQGTLTMGTVISWTLSVSTNVETAMSITPKDCVTNVSFSSLMLEKLQLLQAMSKVLNGLFNLSLIGSKYSSCYF